MSREYFPVNEKLIRDQYLAMPRDMRMGEMERLQGSFMDDVALGDALEDCAQLEHIAIETRARIRILQGFMDAEINESASIQRVRHNLASERPQARIVLKAKFAMMSFSDKREELQRAKQAVESYDQDDLSSETSSEDPLLRHHRITMEETVAILTEELGLH